MEYLIYLGVIAIILFNLFKNKQILGTLFFTTLTIILMYTFNIDALSYKGGFVGISVLPFFLFSFLIMILGICIKIKYKLKNKTISFISLFIFTFIFRALMIPLYGGLVLEGQEYFYHNFHAWINYLAFILLQVNIFINFVSQSKNESV